MQTDDSHSEDLGAAGIVLSEQANTVTRWIGTANGLIDSGTTLLSAAAENTRAALEGGLADADFRRRFARMGYQQAQGLMLYGFAMECLCKGYYLMQSNVLHSGGKLKAIPGVKPAHDLRKIAIATGVAAALTEEELNAIDKLTIFTELGRYPVAADVHRYLHAQSSPDPIGRVRQVWFAPHFIYLKGAIAKLYGLLDSPAPSELGRLDDLARCR